MNNKGFTMVELLVAMAILGLLMVMAFPTMRAIQTSNKNSKYEQYGKAVLSASKLYVDSYEDDIFNKEIKNEDATIEYSKLKEKDLIKDIDIDNTDCSETQVLVIKYNDDYSYCLRMKCKSNNQEVYSRQDDQGFCKEINEKYVKIKYVYKGSKKEYYKIKSNPFTVDKPESLGFTEQINKFIGWKASDGKIYKPNDKITANKNMTLTAQFNSDAKVKIKINANGGQLDSSSLAKGFTLNSGIVNYKGSQYMHNFDFHGSLESTGLIDANNSAFLYLKKPGYHIETGSEWNTKSDGSGQTYNQTSVYSGKDFCTDECVITLYANWKPNYVYIKYNANGGTLTNPHSSEIAVTNNVVTRNGGDILNKLAYNETFPAAGLYNYNNTTLLNIKRPGYYIQSGQEWNTNSKGTGISYNQQYAYSAKDFCDITYNSCTITLYANWKLDTSVSNTHVEHIYYITFTSSHTNCDKSNKDFGDKYPSEVQKRPYRGYNYYRYDCNCPVNSGNMYTNSSYSASPPESNIHNNHRMYIFYTDNTAGENACNGANDYTYNEQVYALCFDGAISYNRTENIGGTNYYYDTNHGYRWYKGHPGSSATYHSFKIGWHHSGGKFDDMYISGKDAENDLTQRKGACQHVCKTIYPIY